MQTSAQVMASPTGTRALFTPLSGLSDPNGQATEVNPHAWVEATLEAIATGHSAFGIDKPTPWTITQASS